MTHTVESIHDWIDNYNFTTSTIASKDIMQQIVRELPNHGYAFGPTENSGYYLNITGPTVNHNFIVKADD